MWVGRVIRHPCESSEASAGSDLPYSAFSPSATWSKKRNLDKHPKPGKKKSEVLSVRGSVSGSRRRVRVPY